MIEIGCLAVAVIFIRVITPSAGISATFDDQTLVLLGNGGGKSNTSSFGCPNLKVEGHYVLQELNLSKNLNTKCSKITDINPINIVGFAGLLCF